MKKIYLTVYSILRKIHNQKGIQFFFKTTQRTFATLSFIVTFLVALDQLPKKFRIIDFTPEPTPLFNKKSTNDSLNILITHFDDYYNEKDSNPVGKIIASRIENLINKKKIPFKVIYTDSIRSPQNPTEAKEFLFKNNGDLLIYGLFKNEVGNKRQGDIYFRTVSLNVMPEMENFDSKLVDRYDTEWRPFKSYDIDKNHFNIDSLNFDNWIQSLLILKQNKEEKFSLRNYQRYRKLYVYNSDSSIGNLTKAYTFYERANLNRAVGNFYDSISETDSIIFYYKKYIDSFTSATFSNVKSINNVITMANFATAFNDQIMDLKEIKYSDYSNFKEPKLALKYIDEDINRIHNSFKQLKPLTEEAGDIDKKSTQSFETVSIHEPVFLSDKPLQVAGQPIISSSWDLSRLYLLKAFIILKHFEDITSIREARVSIDSIDPYSRPLNLTKILSSSDTLRIPPIDYVLINLVLCKKENNLSKYDSILNESEIVKFFPKDTLLKYEAYLINYFETDKTAKKTSKKSFWIYLIVVPLILVLIFAIIKRRKLLF